ncbi:MAG: MBL fold metallo-hydrolase [Bryobacteraceae bacterium]
MLKPSRWTVLAAGAALFIGVPHGRLFAQRPELPSGEVEVLQIHPNFYLIAGAGGNIGMQIGDNGVVLVDSGAAPYTDQVLSAIKKVTDKPIRYIINTSADADHVGGNEKLSRAGKSLLPMQTFVNTNNEGAASILAQDHVLYRMSAPTGQKSPYPTAAQPSETFTEDRHNLFLNGEAVQTIHQPSAHTDGDSMVFFRRSDVVVAGDVFDVTRFPVIDIDKGGSIQGEIDALNNLLDLAVTEIPLVWQQGGTVVIPGHGWLCGQADVLEYRDMITIIRDVIQDQIKKGMTLAQVKAADPTKDYRPRFGRETGPWTTDMFVEAIYKSLTQKK